MGVRGNDLGIMKTYKCDPERRTHVVNLRLKLPLIGDSIEYKDKNKKSKGYTVNDGSFEKEIELPTNNKYVGKNR